jgi:hypothetical protein
MEKIDYRCRNPFNSRIGQFEDGKHTLVVGIDRNAIYAKKSGTFRMTIGKSIKVYTMLYEKLQLPVVHTKWTNPQGREVWIIPLVEFDTEE